MLSVAMAQSCDNNLICYVLPVLWMTSCLVLPCDTMLVLYMLCPCVHPFVRPPARKVINVLIVFGSNHFWSDTTFATM